MFNVIILRTEDFGEELYCPLKDVIGGLIEKNGADCIRASGGKNNMIYRLFCEMAAQYPKVCFSVHLLSLDKETPLIENSDLLICPRGSVYGNENLLNKVGIIRI